jgi:hypothetical protein
MNKAKERELLGGPPKHGQKTTSKVALQFQRAGLPLTRDPCLMFTIMKGKRALGNYHVRT